MGENRSETRHRRVTVAEAAEILGLTVEAVRGRIKRGKLEHAKEDGTVYVILNTDQPTTRQTGQQPVDDQPSDRSTAQAELVEELRGQVAYMREQLAEEREARRRADTILAQLSQANAEQARTIRAIEGDSPIGERPNEAPAPPEASPRPRDAPQTAAEDPEGAGPSPTTEGAEGGTQPRSSWWRRWFGFE